MKQFFLIALVAFFAINVQAQNFDLGKVTKSELEQKKHPIDSFAPAAMLFKKTRTYYRYYQDKGFITYTEFSIKVKIYRKEGLKWADFKIPYFVGYQTLSDESVVISKAFTYNLENGQIKKDKLESEGKFTEEINEFWKTKSITFPNVKVGSIIEFKYVLKSENLSVLPDFQFQYNIPVNFAEYITEIPEFYIYKAVKTGSVDIDLKEAFETATQDFEGRIIGNGQGFSYRQIKSIFTAKNVPAMLEENYVNNINNYSGRISHELETIRMPEQKPKQLANTWEDVSRSIYSEKEFGKELEKFNYFLNDVKPLVLNLTTDQEKASKIFEFVKNRMTWNEKYGYFTRKGVENAYVEKTGNVAEINLMLVAMLRMAGLDANPVLLSTRDNGIAMYPNRFGFNYVIASATINGNQVLLDATDKVSSMNVLPIRDLNATGRLIKKDETSVEIDLTPSIMSKKSINLIAAVKSNGSIEGKSQEQYFDYNAFQFREKNANLSKESHIEKLENKYKNIEIEEYDIANNFALDKPIVETYSFKHNSAIEIIGDKMYFSPLLFYMESENPFKEEKRALPIDLGYPTQDKYNITIEMPQGYVVESLPAKMNIDTEDGFGAFKYIIGATGNKIQISITADINKAVYTADYFEVLKDFFQKKIDKQNEKIVLKKA